MSDIRDGLRALAHGATDRTPAPPLHRLLAPCPPIPLTVAGRDMTLTCAPWSAPDDDAVALPLTAGDMPATLHLPTGLVDHAFHSLGMPVDPETPALPRALLIELACLGMVTALEAALDLPVRSGLGGGTHPDRLTLHLASDAGEWRVTAELGRGLADRLAQALDRHHPAERTEATERPLRLTVRLGRQVLTAAEIATLAEGDVVLLDPSPALAVVEGSHAAAVEVTEAGVILRSAFLPLPDDPDLSGYRHVEVELARRTLTLGAVNALSTGDALPVARFDGAAADLTCAGTTLGHGVVVTLGAGTGLRLTSLSPELSSKVP